VRAAREARAELAESVAAVQREASGPTAWLEDDVSKVVRLLYAAETASAAAVVDTIGRAIDQLRAILVQLQGVVAAGSVDEITRHVARTLAVLYPVRRELERAVAGGAPPPADEPAIPLVRRRDADRRAADRVRVLADVGFHSDSNFFTGFSSDVSDGGLFVATYDLLPVGTELTLSFVLPEGHQITVTGRVSWIRELSDSEDLHPGMGIAFDDLSARDHAAIQRFIAQRTPLFYER
jgi:uncharacterized protein (TIGR02266 family)